MSSSLHLASINVFVGDIQGGLGPFLATWLAQAGHWSPARIGLVTTIVGLATLALNGPAGALVDRSGRPRLLLALSCGAILAGTLLLLLAGSFAAVLAAQFLATAGGTMVPPALNALTLGMVGKAGFPRQQGRNQAFNHTGILGAALVIGVGTRWLGPGVAFWVLGAMALAALGAVGLTPSRLWNGRRALGWQEDEPDETDHAHPILAVLRNRRLLLLACALALFNLGNGNMLSLLGQRLAAAGADATRWTATYVIVAQLTMVPVALCAGAWADRSGRRLVLLVAFAALVLRAVLSAVLTSPLLLIPAEVLDGLSSGLLGVAVPVLVADLTWGSGRTQTGYGAVNTLQGLGGALSGVASGALVGWLGWSGTLLALAVPGAAAVGIVIWLAETRDAGVAYPPRSRGAASPGAAAASGGPA